MRGIAVLVLAVAAFATPAAAEYPEKPIRLIVPQAPGSATDTVARTLGAELSKELGQQIIVDNRPRRRAHHRARYHGEIRAGRLHALHGADRRARHHAAHGGEATLRYRARLPADRAGRARPHAARGLARCAIQDHPGADRIREEESRQAVERVVEQR